MIMQISVAPAAIIRSTRYSDTALGRSTPFTVREPTGSSSLEQPNGWIRWPAPAAGIIPIIRRPRLGWQRWRSELLQGTGAVGGRGPGRCDRRACVRGHVLPAPEARLRAC